MRFPAVFTASVFSAFAAFAAGDVVYDAKARTVSFSAVSTDCGVDTDLEFLFVGPDSDRGYEAMFLTVSPIAEITDAFEKAGFPKGIPIDTVNCRLWSVGSEITMEPAFTNLVRDLRGPGLPPIVYTGGTRDAKGIPEASTNMPSALFALYNCPQSPILFDDAFDQSATYGRFKPAVKIAKGEKRRFTFRWNGETTCRRIDVKFESGNLKSVATKLKEESAKSKLDVFCSYSPAMTVKEARDAAQLLAMIDSAKVKINGIAEGEIFYKAYQPLEKWRDRKERLSQPPEVRFNEDGSVSVTEIKEDWSDKNSLDPKLTAFEKKYTDHAEAAKLVDRLSAKVFTVFFYVSDDTRLERLFSFKKRLTTSPLNVYVFTE